jgi:hypothetical protein
VTDESQTPSDSQRKPVLGIPPVDATDEELEAWARQFLDQALGPIAPGAEDEAEGSREKG